MTLTGALAALLLAAPVSAAPVPDRTGYAWRFPLSGGDAAEYRAAPLPLEVYRSATDPALRDIGVYNAAGDAVPRRVEAPAPPAAGERAVALNPIPLAGPPAEQREQLRLLMQQGAGGTTLSLDTRADTGTAADAETAAGVSAYLVDLREHDAPIETLEFDWGDTAAGFIGSVQVDTSDDLQGWRPLARGTLADLAHEDARIEQDRVVLDRAPGDFVRIRWSDLPAGWALRALRGIRPAPDGPPTRDRLELEPVAIEDDGRTLVYDAGGFPPVDRVNLMLPGDNIVVRARVFHRSAADDPWRPAYEGVFYHVRRDGRAVQSSPAAVAPVRAPHWQVRIESGAPPAATAGGLRLQLGWRPERLLFVAQGAGPFELAAGRARDRIEDFPQHRMLGDPAIFSALAAAGEPGGAVVGPRETLAGADALTLDRPVPWRTALVWAGLIGAVLLVAGLAVSLLRELKRDAVA